MTLNSPVQRFAAVQRILNTPAPNGRRSIVLPTRATFASVLQRTTTPLAQPKPISQPKPLALPVRSLVASSTDVGPGSGPVPYQDLIEAAARRNGIDPALLAAVAKTESGFNPRAQSGAGAKGLMQLMDRTAAGLGVSDSFDPAQSLEGGARFLSGLLRQFHGDVRLAVAAYNAGPVAVQKYGGIPPYQETQRYVPQVLAQADAYRRIWADHSPATEMS